MVNRLRTQASNDGASNENANSASGLSIPERPADAKTGSQLATEFQSLSLSARDSRVLGELLLGNMPPFMRQLVDITVTETLSGVSHTLVYKVIPDYLSLGSDADYLRMPMTPLTAQTAGDSFGSTLPTTKMVDQIHAAAAAKLEPWGFDPQNGLFSVFVTSNTKINQQLVQLGTFVAGQLVGGDKKDVVTTVQLATSPGKVAIYGFQYPDGTPVQPLFVGHDITYVDYSQCIRVVLNAAILDGEPCSLLDVLADPVLSALISNEGPVKAPRYQGTATIPNPPPPSDQGQTGDSGNTSGGNTGGDSGGNSAPGGDSGGNSGDSGGTSVPSNSNVAPGLIQMPAGTLGLDRSLSIGPQAAALYQSGYRFAIRNVNLPTLSQNGALTAPEAKEILEAGIALGLYQTYREHNVTEEQGTEDGQFIANMATTIGFPQGATLYCDLESSSELKGVFYAPDGSPVSVQTMMTYLENWATAVTTQGYLAGLYNGPQALLSSSDLSALKGFSSFWVSTSTVPSPSLGYQLKQRNPNKVIDGVNIDEDVAAADASNNLPSFWAPSAAPSSSAT